MANHAARSRATPRQNRGHDSGELPAWRGHTPGRCVRSRADCGPDGRPWLSRRPPCRNPEGGCPSADQISCVRPARELGSLIARGTWRARRSTGHHRDPPFGFVHIGCRSSARGWRKPSRRSQGCLRRNGRCRRDDHGLPRHDRRRCSRRRSGCMREVIAPARFAGRKEGFVLPKPNAGWPEAPICGTPVHRRLISHSVASAGPAPRRGRLRRAPRSQARIAASNGWRCAGQLLSGTSTRALDSAIVHAARSFTIGQPWPAEIMR